MLLDVSNSPAEIAVFIAIAIDMHGITATCMDEDGIPGVYELCELAVLFRVEWWEDKGLEDVIVDSLNVIAVIHERQPHTRIDVLIGLEEQPLRESSEILQFVLMPFVMPIPQCISQMCIEQKIDLLPTEKRIGLFIRDTFRVEIVSCLVYQMKTGMVKGLRNVGSIVPLLVPEFRRSDLIDYSLPLLFRKQFLDIRRFQVENSVKFVAIPLGDDFIALRNIVNDGLNITLVCRVLFLNR